MVRYTFALRGESKDAEHQIRIEEQSIDLTKGEQLTESFMCEVNAAGEVGRDICVYMVK